MRVKDLMTTEVATCRPESSLAEVATTMWHRDCGCLPVVAADGHVAGMITDRDIAIAVATRGRIADHIQVREVMTGCVFGCEPADDVKQALDTMRTRKVRRLPVLDASGHLKGILSLNDVALHAGPKRDVGATELLETMRGICEHEPLVALARA